MRDFYKIIEPPLEQIQCVTLSQGCHVFSSPLLLMVELLSLEYDLLLPYVSSTYHVFHKHESWEDGKNQKISHTSLSNIRLYQISTAYEHKMLLMQSKVKLIFTQHNTNIKRNKSDEFLPQTQIFVSMTLLPLPKKCPAKKCVTCNTTEITIRKCPEGSVLQVCPSWQT